MAVCYKQVHAAIVVKIKKLYSPTTHQGRRHTHDAGRGFVVEGAVVIIVVEGIMLVVNVVHEQIRPAVLVVVGRIDTHSRTGATFGAVSHASFQARFLEL